jgi:hypothetical protein
MKKSIPGTVTIEGTGYLYFSDDGKHSFSKQFWTLTNYVTPPHAQCGGVVTQRCRIKTPGGEVFHAISYHGDLTGWRMDLEEGAQKLNLTLAEIKNSKLLLSTGVNFDLDTCEIIFW